MKNQFSFQRINMKVINLSILVLVLACGIYTHIKGNDRYSVLVYLILLVLTIGINVLVSVLAKRETNRLLQSLVLSSEDKSGMTSGWLKPFQLPVIFFSETGKLIWFNSFALQLFSSKDEMKRAAKELFLLRIRNKLASHVEEMNSTVEFADRHFQMLCNVVRLPSSSHGSLAVMASFIDITEWKQLQKLHDDTRIAVGEIAIDSYEEIYQSSGEAVINQILVELSKLFDKWLEGKEALVRKLVRDRYLILIEHKYLEELEKERFAILAMAKEISFGNNIPVTLSIGISASPQSVAANFMEAEAALDLALGRGGDQAIVRVNGSDTYYGSSNLEVARRTKVKARVISNLLQEEIDKSSRVLIMGHSNCDMDSLGAALAVYRAAKILDKNAIIVMNNENQSIAAMMQKLRASGYGDIFVDTSYALNLIDEDALVVVVDTFKQSMTECPRLLDYASRVAVIDHHRRGADFIQNTVLYYSETYASSTSELMIEILSYMAPHISIPTVEAEALYAGILVDTKNFTFKTGIRTFEAASYLRSQGVDTVSVRMYSQPDFETFSQISAVTSTTQIVEGCVAVAVCGPNIKNAKFVAALAADQMLNVAGIDASFVLSESNGTIFISGRSFGDINVQVILEGMGGGGHLTSAGAALSDVSLEYAQKTLYRHIREYLGKQIV